MPALTYAQWTELLGRHFFHSGRAGQPVTFFVDDEVLAQLAGSGDPHAAEASLAAAVKGRIGRDSYGRRFHGIDQDCTMWKISGANGFPPSLPLLAVAVLAATHMARETGIGKNNYWKRFRDVLDLHDKNDLKDAGDVFPGLWDQLSWWLDDHHKGALGKSTVESDSWWTIIGYALSQALFRESDRQHLTDLFRKLGLTPGEEPNPRELLQYFKAWAPVSPLSPGARHMAGDARYDERLMAILRDEAIRWDGVLRDARGRRIGALVVAYEPAPRPTYTIAAERPPGFPERAPFTQDGETRELSSSIDGWYDERWPLDPRWLAHGLRLEAGEFVLAYRGAPVVALARDRDLGCWSSVVRIDPGEKYLVLADDAHTHLVEDFLRTHARDEWKREGDGFSPAGWVMFSGVVIEESLADVPSGPLAVLAPKIRDRPTLKGGLVLDASLNLYLCGGEPDLWLPSLLDPTTPIEVDGARVAASAGQRVALADRRLKAGAHEIVVGAATLHFWTTRALRDDAPPGAGTIGHDLTRLSDGRYEPRSKGANLTRSDGAYDGVAIVGSHLVGAVKDLPQSQRTIILPLGARRYQLIGANAGEITEPREPRRPEWLDEAGHGTLYPFGFEVSPNFEVVWVIVERALGVTVRLREARPPVALAVEPSLKINAWCDAFERDAGDLAPDQQALWLEYRMMAATLPRLSPGEAAQERVVAEGRAAPAQTRRTDVVAPSRELVVEPTRLRLPLLVRTTHVHMYESTDQRFQITYWKKFGNWTVTERPHEKSKEKKLIGEYESEQEALAAISRAIRTVRTVKPG